MSTPTGKGVAVDGVEQGLGDGLEQLIRALKDVSADNLLQSCPRPSIPIIAIQGGIGGSLTRSGSHKLSHMPNN
jgi:hypothetical protein